MTYDLIIVSQSRGDLIQMTERCIESARQDGANLNVIIVETGNPYKYNIDKIVQYNGEFSYNRALNLGLKYAIGDVHILANNDLIFHKGWSQIGELMKLNGIHSASCKSSHQALLKDNLLYEGYVIGHTLNGWCIFIDDYCLGRIGQLDETMSFWYSDDLYALQLKKAGIMHGLFTNCIVDHITSATLKKQNHIVQKQYQTGEYNKYLQRKRYYAEGKANHAAHT